MRTFFRAFCGVALAASAVALEKEFVDQIMQSAQNIERDASLVSQASTPLGPARACVVCRGAAVERRNDYEKLKPKAVHSRPPLTIDEAWP